LIRKKPSHGFQKIVFPAAASRSAAGIRAIARSGSTGTIRAIGVRAVVLVWQCPFPLLFETCSLGFSFTWRTDLPVRHFFIYTLHTVVKLITLQNVITIYREKRNCVPHFILCTIYRVTTQVIVEFVYSPIGRWIIRTKCGTNTPRLPDGNVAYGNWNPNNRKVRFNWNNPDNRNSNSGGRVEISREGVFISKAPFAL
jgi:hypothetical protein